jgi:lambda repressor-like predicted transcriptional regulator
VSVADQHGLGTQNQHWKKAQVAAELHKRGVLPTDYSDLLGLLIEARKAAT